MIETQSFQAFSQSSYSTTKHSTYFEVYDELFTPFKNKDIVFVEIGVLDGGSLFMWRKFFGPQATIIGVDLNPDAKRWEEYGFQIKIGDQGDKNFWDKFIEEIGLVDVILDDGGHTYMQQIITAEMLYFAIRDGGMLVVEDTHTSYMKGFGPTRYTFVKYAKHVIDVPNRRFANSNPTLGDKRVWSVEFFESIIAFKINRKATNLVSTLVNNQGTSVSSLDFRYHDNLQLNMSLRIFAKFPFLKKFGILRCVKTGYFHFITKKGVSRKIRRYFGS